MNGNRVLLMVLSERTSAKGNTYLSGWLGKAQIVAFRGEPDKYNNPTWELYVSEPEPRPERGDPPPAPINSRRDPRPDEVALAIEAQAARAIDDVKEENGI